MCSRHATVVSVLLTTVLLIVVTNGLGAGDEFRLAQQSGSSDHGSFTEYLEQTSEARAEWRRESSAAMRRFQEAVAPYREYWLDRAAELSRRSHGATPAERARLREERTRLYDWYREQTRDAYDRWSRESSAARERYLDRRQPYFEAWANEARARYEAMVRDFRRRSDSGDEQFPARREVYSSLLDLTAYSGSGPVSEQVLETVYDAYGSAGGVSWDDVQRFQHDLVRTTDYRHEARALHPSEFYATGGGNCVDYALATAAFLQHHGVRSYVGGFFPPGEQLGHAVVLVPVTEVPAGFASVTISGWKTEDGRSVPDGTYVPIDYEHVGGFSNATAPNAELTRIWRPEHLVGLW